jgi:hypothetical protein
MNFGALFLPITLGEIDKPVSFDVWPSFGGLQTSTATFLKFGKAGQTHSHLFPVVETDVLVKQTHFGLVRIGSK